MTIASDVLSAWIKYEQAGNLVKTTPEDSSAELVEAVHAWEQEKISLDKCLTNALGYLDSTLKDLEMLIAQQDLDELTLNHIKVYTTKLLGEMELQTDTGVQRTCIVGIPVFGFEDRMSGLMDVKQLFENSGMIHADSKVFVLGHTDVENALCLAQDPVAIQKFVGEFFNDDTSAISQYIIGQDQAEERMVASHVLLVAITARTNTDIPAYDWIDEEGLAQEHVLSGWEREVERYLKNKDDEFQMLLNHSAPLPLWEASVSSLATHIGAIEINIKHALDQQSKGKVFDQQIAQMGVLNDGMVEIVTVFDNHSIHRCSLFDVPKFLALEVLEELDLELIDQQQEPQWLSGVLPNNVVPFKRTLH